jgi:O-antigen/teichoic acid export membrane protein
MQVNSTLRRHGTCLLPIIGPEDAAKPAEGEVRVGEVTTSGPGPSRVGGVIRSVRSVGGRLSWGLIDQAISSLTNFAVGIVVAHNFGLDEFGAFTLAWFTYGLIVNISRGLATDPLVVRFSGGPVAAWRTAVSRTSATAVAVGIATGAICLLVGLAVSGPVGGALVGLGVVLPVLMLQDSWRYAFFAAGVGHKACLNDLVWGLSLIPALAVAVQRQSLFGLVVAWGLAGGVAALYGCWQARIVPNPRGIRTWLRDQKDLGLRYLFENVTQSGGVQLRMYALGAIAGLADVAALRGAQLLLGPLLAVLMGIGAVAVPEAVRWLRRSRRHLTRFCVALGSAEAFAALSWGLGLLIFLPRGGGSLVLGPVWGPASVLVLPLTLSVIVGSFTTGATTGLRALGAARRSLRSQLLETGMFIVATIVGATLAGALGATWAALLAAVLSATIWWSQLRRALHGSAQSEPTPDLEDAGPVTAR